MKRLFPPPKNIQQRAWVDAKKYQELYDRSLKDPEGFWAEMASTFVWYQEWRNTFSYDWKDKIDVKWFEGAQTNICVNAIDRHLPTHADRIAYRWVGNTPGEEKTLTYKQLHQEVNRCANVLKSLGVKKGDRVAIYLPMILELPVSLLACARIGAIHSVIFGGFSSESLKDRILDSKCKLLITSDGGFRGNKTIPLKQIADDALTACLKAGHNVENCLVVERTKEKINFQNGRDVWWHDLMKTVSPECAPEKMDAEDPLFILYTSGSTGKPKGVLHTTAGYMVYAAATFKYVFDYHLEDIYWCTADIGWITGHSYIVYGPLLNAASSILFEGIPTFPEPDRFWEVIEKYKVSTFYTAPTALRSLMGAGDPWVKKHDLSSLKILGSVGEPINPEAWLWYHEVVGGNRCPIVDTWWQTETGGILISPLPGATTLKPGSAMKPFFGIEPAILKDDGTECGPNEGGALVIKHPWPGIMRTVYGHHERFKETYFQKFPGYYLAGDSAMKDQDGDIWFLGRMDDVLKVSGHRIGTAEVESALVSHHAVAESAVVGFPHAIKGEAIYAFVTLKTGVPPSEELKKELVTQVRQQMGAIAAPEKIQFAPGLPKTRSGKIMRRILKKIASGETDQIGDTTTLADPAVVEELIKNSLGPATNKRE